MMNDTPPTLPDLDGTIQARLLGLLEAVLQKSSFNRAFIPTIRNLAKSFIEDTSEADLKNGIVILRDKFIPWLLGEASNENPPPE